MIQLAKHIEILLLENDCVIVPGLGGFVAHYTPAARTDEENLFLPPTRIIGFNPRLKMNDGLLVQSYMAACNTNFPDATRMVEKEVEAVSAALHEDGKVDLPNVGELRYSIRGTYEFLPYDHKIATPYLYGLDSFEMQELAELKKPYPVAESVVPHPVPAVRTTGRRRARLRPNRSFASGVAAMIAAVALFFFLSAPIENTEVVEGNYAQLMPEELFEMIEKQSLAIQPIVVSRPATASQAKVPAPSEKKQEKELEEKKPEKKEVKPVAVKEVKVKQQAATATPKKYHVIVASVGTQKDAEAMAKQLVGKGYAHAKAIIGDGKMRVSIESCATEAEAYRALEKVRTNEAYQSAWVLKK